MSRPARLFSLDKSREIAAELREKVSDPVFVKTYLLKEGEDVEEATSRAIFECELLFSAALDDELPARLQSFLSGKFSDANWTRFLAARRQRKLQTEKPDHLAAMTQEAGERFADLAQAAGITKKDYFEWLSWFLTSHVSGRVTAERLANLVEKKTARPRGQ